MDNAENGPFNLYKNDAFSPSLEMNVVGPAIPKLQPSTGPTCVAYAVGKFENAHISLFQVSTHRVNICSTSHRYQFIHFRPFYVFYASK